MTIHVNIGKAKAQLSKLIAAAERGEEVILDKAGKPVARIVPLGDQEVARREEIIRSRKSAFGMYKHLVGNQEIEIPPSMTDEELEERFERKFGPSA